MFVSQYWTSILLSPGGQRDEAIGADYVWVNALGVCVDVCGGRGYPCTPVVCMCVSLRLCLH